MKQADAKDWLKRLHEAQDRFYAGQDQGQLAELLSPEIEWHIPGNNAIAGHYRGVSEVMAYFERRRLLADDTLRLDAGDVLVGSGEWVANLVDGVALIDGQEERWSTVGLYRLRNGLVHACRLLPLDAAAFDRIWSPAGVGESDA